MKSCVRDKGVTAEPTRIHSSRMRTARSRSCQLGGHLPQCMLGYPLGVGLETLLGVNLETPLGVGLENLAWVWAWRPPWVWAWRTPRTDPSTPPLGVGHEHEHTKMAILLLLPTLYSQQFPSLFTPSDVSKCEIKFQLV